MKHIESWKGSVPPRDQLYLDLGTPASAGFLFGMVATGIREWLRGHTGLKSEMAKKRNYKVTYSLTAELNLRVISSDGDGARTAGDEATLDKRVVRGTLETGETFELVVLSGDRVACQEEN
jgi:hypothetical protein